MTLSTPKKIKNLLFLSPQQQCCSYFAMEVKPEMTTMSYESMFRILRNFFIKKVAYFSQEVINSNISYCIGYAMDMVTILIEFNINTIIYLYFYHQSNICPSSFFQKEIKSTISFIKTFLRVFIFHVFVALNY